MKHAGPNYMLAELALNVLCLPDFPLNTQAGADAHLNSSNPLERVNECVAFIVCTSGTEWVNTGEGGALR